MRRDTVEPLAPTVRTNTEEVPHEQGNVLSTRAKRWHDGGHHVQAIVKIFAEPAELYQLAQILSLQG